MNTFALTFDTLPGECPSCGAGFRRQYDVIGLTISDYTCGMALYWLSRTWVVRQACPQGMGYAIQLRSDISRMENERRPPTLGVLQDIRNERERQESKWGEQNHTPVEWLAILGEEVGEACKEAITAHFHGPTDAIVLAYRLEMVQVAAVAVAAIEALDRWGGK